MRSTVWLPTIFSYSSGRASHAHNGWKADVASEDGSAEQGEADIKKLEADRT
jgi:hypothetical protein